MIRMWEAGIGAVLRQIKRLRKGLGMGLMGFKKPRIREPLGEAGLFEYAVGALARRMRTVRDLRRLMKARAVPGTEGEAAMDAVVARLIELNYLSDTRFAADYTRLRKEGEKFGRRRVQQDLAGKGVAPDTVATA